MDRLNQLRGEAGPSRDSTLDTSSPPSEAYITANESSSKYFSLSEVDSTFDISPIKDVSLAPSSIEAERTITESDRLIANLSPIGKKNDFLDSYKIGKQIEAANILSGGVDIFDDNDNSYDGDELVIDDNVLAENKGNTELKIAESEHKDDNSTDATLLESEPVPSKDTEVILQIDGKNVDAIDIGNGLYLYRREGEEELAAVQIDEDKQQPSFKFLKVRENAEGNLEVYEEIPIEVPKELPLKEGKSNEKKVSHAPIKDIKVMSDTSNKNVDKINKIQSEPLATLASDLDKESNKDQSDSKIDVNGKLMKFSESRKSPVVGSFTPMAYHSTPSKEGIPLTKTMVDLQLHPNRHSDNVKKTIEVHTDNSKQKTEPLRNLMKDFSEDKNKQVVSEIKTDTSDKHVMIEEKNKVAAVESNEEKCKDDTIETKTVFETKKECEELNIKNKDDDESHRNDVKNETNTSNVKILSTLENDLDVANLDQNSKLTNQKQSEKDKPAVKNVTAMEKITKHNVDSDQKKEDKLDLNTSSINEHNVEIQETQTDDLEEIKLEEIKIKESNIDNKQKLANEPELNRMEDVRINEGILETNKIETVKIQECNVDNKQNQEVLLKINEVEIVKKQANTKQESRSEVNEIKTTKIQKYNLENEPKQMSKIKMNITEVVKVQEHFIDNKNQEGKSEMHKIEAVVFKKHNFTEEFKEFKSKIDEHNVDKKKQTLTIISTPDTNKMNEVVVESKTNQTKYSDPDKNIFVKDSESSKADANNGNKPCNPKIKFDCGSEISAGMSSFDMKCVPSLSLPSASDNLGNISATHTDDCIGNKANVVVNNVNTKSDTPNEENTQLTQDVQFVKTVPTNIVADSESNLDKNIKGVEYTIELNTDNQVSTQNVILDNSITLATAEKKTSNNSESKETLEHINTAIQKETDVVDFSLKEVTDKIYADRKDISDKKDDAINTVEAMNKKSPPNLDIAKKELSKRINRSNLDTTNKETVNVDITKQELKGGLVETSKKITTQIVDISKRETSATKNETMKTEIKTVGFISSETKIISPVDMENKDLYNKEIKIGTLQNAVQNKDNLTDKKVIPRITSSIDFKSVSNNHAPVPFGKWTEANRQAFLNRIKETKVPSNSSNGKQIKNSNDLNRRDFLKKIDAPRPIQSNTSTTKVQDFGSSNRLGVKKEASVFSNKPVAQESELPPKTDVLLSKSNETPIKKILKQESLSQSQVNATSILITEATIATKKEPPNKKESSQRKEINNQDLIDKTIEGIINRAAPSKSQEDNIKETIISIQNKEPENVKNEQPVGLDEIEMKMNELHGIPFIERPAHELPRVINPVIKTYTKSESQTSRQTKIPNLIPFANKNQQKGVKDNIIDIDSEEEVIEHEPITGDMDVVKKNITGPPVTEKSEIVTQNVSDTKKDGIITEKEFDKFARRNSVNYENCITVKFDNTESPNVVNTVVQKDNALKTYQKHDKKSLSITTDLLNQSVLTKPVHNITKTNVERIEETNNKNYQSKVKMAYQTAMTAKRQMERPIPIIEDKPVKVVFMDNNAEFIPRQLNAQGKELSPAKKQIVNVDLSAATDSLDSDILEINDGKSQEDTKTKTKHQRKQVLTPVDTPDLELIESDELGAEVTPKKKRKTEEKIEKSSKIVVPKKSYLLGRGHTIEDTAVKSYELPTVFNKETLDLDKSSSHKNTASAIDNLVKAAELLETQSGNIINKSSSEIKTSDSQQNTPVKRGRGRPRKYPLPEAGSINKTKIPSPEKKPRLIEDKMLKVNDTDDDDDDSSDEGIIKENWTMGKINENIVCPICDKLFRSENVVFKHVKHCTGPSPNRSESGNKSPRRLRESQDSDSKFDGMDIDDYESLQKDVRKKRKSRDTNPKSLNDKNEIIVIEDTPMKPRPEKRQESKNMEPKKSIINKSKISNLICEFCGKTFRQLSYLVNHKLQHEKGDTKKGETDVSTSKSVFSCEVCKKEFRKLHHLVQHRIIHNLNSSIPAKRKSSSEQNESKVSKDQSSTKQNDDASAGFRCEPCDKSFRKLHHLVEHRETHDCINRQKSTSTVHAPAEKPPPPPQCDICKKTFRKLHHLIEHKEQHLETSSEKSDDKSIKSSLSTKDIIHECSLCYMVFPNEHSLNKHTIICQRKKRQSATKQAQQAEQSDANEEDPAKKSDEHFDKDDVIIVSSEIKEKDTEILLTKEINKQDVSDEKVNTVETTIDLSSESPNAKNIEKIKEIDAKSNDNILVENKDNKDLSVASEHVERLDGIETNKVVDMPKKVIDMPKENIKTKKTPLKDKVASTVTKRQKLNLSVVEDVKPTDSSDDEDVRYMLNPDFKVDNTNEGKIFMKVRAKKRNSLQIERPDSKDLIKRRISLQHPPKIPRLKTKTVTNKTILTNAVTLKKNIEKPLKLEPVPSTDSDDSDVKYSFPKAVINKNNKTKIEEPLTKDQEKKKQRKSLTEKRKSLTGIAKKKSLSKAISPKHKVKPITEKLIKKRIVEVEHRCDCGQLFSSAALLSRHTTLAHTPPRIRKRRSPLPVINKMVTKPASKQIITTAKSRQSESRKSSVKSEGGVSNAKTTRVTPSRKSSIQKCDVKLPEGRKIKTSDKVEAATTSTPKVRRNAAQRGVPIPEKMRKLMEKSKK